MRNSRAICGKASCDSDPFGSESQLVRRVAPGLGLICFFGGAGDRRGSGI